MVPSETHKTINKEELVAGIREFWTARMTKERCTRYIEHVRIKVVPRVVELGDANMP